MQPPLGLTARWASRVPVFPRGRGAAGGQGLPDVTILNYHKIRDWGHPCRKAFAGAVFDEGQELRTGSPQVPAAVKAASAPRCA